MYYYYQSAFDLGQVSTLLSSLVSSKVWLRTHRRSFLSSRCMFMKSCGCFPDFLEHGKGFPNSSVPVRCDKLGDVNQGFTIVKCIWNNTCECISRSTGTKILANHGLPYEYLTIAVILTGLGHLAVTCNHSKLTSLLLDTVWSYNGTTTSSARFSNTPFHHHSSIIQPSGSTRLDNLKKNTSDVFKYS